MPPHPWVGDGLGGKWGHWGALPTSPGPPHAAALGQCPANQVYQECGDTCVKTCSNPQHSCSSFCTFGCFCPEGEGTVPQGTPPDEPRGRAPAPNPAPRTRPRDPPRTPAVCSGPSVQSHGAVRWCPPGAREAVGRGWGLSKAGDGSRAQGVGCGKHRWGWGWGHSPRLHGDLSQGPEQVSRRAGASGGPGRGRGRQEGGRRVPAAAPGSPFLQAWF